MDPTLFDPPNDDPAPAPPDLPGAARLRATARPQTTAGTRDRRHTSPPRRAVLRMRLSEAELTDITTAATRLHLTPSGYAAEAATTAARDQAGLHLDVLRAALTDLVSAREQLRRLTHTAAASHRSLAPSTLEVAAERAVIALEGAASDLVQSLRDQQQPRQRPPRRTSARGRPGDADGRPRPQPRPTERS